MFLLLVAFGFNSLILQPAARGQELAAETNHYELRQAHDPDGIGKFYLGREIAQVMGHESSAWLERPERVAEESPNLMVSELVIRPGEVIADIGAGTGYLSRRLAQRVGPTGRILAVDVQPEMLALLKNLDAALGLTNITGVLGTAADSHLAPGSVDLAIMVDVYHEFEFPREMMLSICGALKVAGRVVLVEYRAEDPSVPIKPLHKMTEAQVKKELSLLPLQWTRTVEVLPRQHMIFFQKRPDSSAGASPHPPGLR